MPFAYLSNSLLAFLIMVNVVLSEAKTEFKPCGSCGGSALKSSPCCHLPFSALVLA